MTASFKFCLVLLAGSCLFAACSPELEPEPEVAEAPEVTLWRKAPQASAAEQLVPADIPTLGAAALGTAIVDVLEPLTEFEGVSVEVRDMEHPNGRLRYRKHVMVTPKGGEVDHGPDWRWWENGQIRFRRIWREGKADGPFMEWHKSGFQKSLGVLSRDLPDGVWERWYGTGEPKAWEEFRDGVREGLEVRWHKTGAYMHQKSWTAGVENGLLRQWDTKGSLLVDGVMVEGVKDGVWREWWPGAGLQRSSSFELGRPDGVWIEFYESGGARVQGAYKGGLREGRWEAWLENGQGVAVEHFHSDLLEGERAVWGEAGGLLSIGSYEAGVGVGVHYEYGLDEVLMMRRTHDDPPGSDRVERWWGDERPRSAGLFVDGKRDGVWKAWREDGSEDAEISGTWRLGERVAD